MLLRKTIRLLFAAVGLTGLCLGIAQADPVLTPNITPIYSQAVFGKTPITIDYLPLIYLNGPDTVASQADWTNLHTIAPAAAPVVDAFYVNSITWCGTVGDLIAGCADQPGNILALDEPFVNAGGVTASQDVAHELGHNLGLAHVAPAVADVGDNLMNPVLLGNTTLTAGQATTVLASALVQTALDGSLFIDVQPIEMPEPATLVVFGVGIAGLAGARRTVRRRG